MKCILKSTEALWDDDLMSKYVQILTKSGFKVTCEMVQDKWGRKPELVIDIHFIAELDAIGRLVGHDIVFMPNREGLIAIEIYDGYRE